MRHLLTLVLLVVLAVAAPAPAAAQASRPSRPYRGLFGSGNADLQQSLNVSGSVGAGYDSDLFADAREAVRTGGGSSGTPQPGTLGQFSGVISYGFASEAVNIAASATSSGRYYPTQGNSLVRREQANLQASAEWGGLSVFGAASYAPFRISALYETFFTPELAEPSSDFDFGSSTQHYVAYSGGAGWGWQVSRRTRFTASYRTGSRLSTAEVPRQRTNEAGGGLRYNLGRGLDLNLGYRYIEARYESRDPYVSQALNAGVDFERALSFSRRTTVAFTTGTAATEDPASGGGMHLRAIGNAALNHEIGRTWRASISYNRNLRFTEAWTEPIFSDAAVVSLTGLVSRRVGVQARVGGSSGRVSVANSGGFNTYFADTGVHFALGRFAAFATSYRYHHHEFRNGVSGAPGILPFLNRHSLHAHISLWAPIFQSARRP